MKLYCRECRRTAADIIYWLFIAILVFSWFQNFRGVTKTEIDRTKGISSDFSIAFDRPLLAEPEENDEYFGSKTSEDNPKAIMTGVTKLLVMEYKNNSYATYPMGYYKAISLNAKNQSRVLEILCRITGLAEEQIKDLPQDYFPAATGTIFSTGNMTTDKDGSIVFQNENTAGNDIKVLQKDKAKKFVPQVSYQEFNAYMREMEDMIGEKGSGYSKEMMITYFGISQMTFEEAYADYNQTIQKDKVTGGFARLFCDYMGLSLGLYPVFVVVFMWLKDRTGNTAELIYCRRISSVKLVVSRYLADITMVLIPVVLLSLESLIPLISFGAENGLSIDYFAFIKYIFWWLLPTVMIVSATGIFFTLLTDSPIAIVLQFLWWFIDRGLTGLSGNTKITTLMIRHNTLRGCEIIRDGFETICMNRLLLAGLSIIFVILSAWILGQKRKGRINAANIYRKCFGHIQNKFSFSHTK